MEKVMEFKKNIFYSLFFMLFCCSFGVNSTASEVSFIPKNYLLQIETEKSHFEKDSDDMNYKGVVTIDFEMKKPNDFNKDFKIMLNTNPKTIMKDWDIKGSGSSESLKSHCKQGIFEDKWFFNCTKEAAKYKEFTMNIEYYNPFGKDMTGFYRSSYTDSNNKKSWLLTTHFEPIFARNAFPCFDQPHLKATFEVHLTVPSNIKTVLSNTPLNDKPSDVVNDLKIFKFKKTEIPMSTYLVAFTASNLKPTDPVDFVSDYPTSKQTNKKLTTYGRSDIIDRGDGNLGQNVGKKAIEELTKYLGIGYAFEKVDQVGIPDFSAGAMENWGHISFREKSLFFNEKKDSAITKQANVLTITHELVHQWFGNLVTLKSWDYIWLNEAFATYIEYIIASKYQDPDLKDWNLMNQLVVNEIHLRAFETDGLVSSKPLNNIIKDESLIFSSFNDIPYSKGAAVLRMWDLALKNNGFQNSLKHYLEKRKQDSATPNDLFDAFKSKAEMNEEFFKTWTDQAGYPVVEVKKVNGSYEVSQSRFCWEKLDNSKNIWLIPISYTTKSSKNFNPSPSLWLADKSVKLNAEVSEKWIIVNNQQAGYYRVNYEESNWNALSEALAEKDHSGIPEVNRAQIINDIFSLARSVQKNYVSYPTALKLIKYLEKESSFIAWKTALNAFDFLNTKLYKSETYNRFKAEVLSLVKPHFKGLNFTSKNHIDRLMNIEISRWSCSLDLESCVKQAKAIFEDKTKPLFPDTQEIILCTVVRNDDKAWNQVFEEYKKESDSSMKLMYISALGCTNKESQAEEFLKKTLSQSNEIRKQDLIYVLSAVYNGNMKNVDTAFNFVENNYKTIAKDFGGINPLGRALVGIAKRINNAKQFEKLKALAKKIKESTEAKAAEESIENALKIASNNVLWVNERMDQFRAYYSAGSHLSYSFGLLMLCLIFVTRF